MLFKEQLRKEISTFYDGGGRGVFTGILQDASKWLWNDDVMVLGSEEEVQRLPTNGTVIGWY